MGDLAGVVEATRSSAMSVHANGAGSWPDGRQAEGPACLRSILSGRMASHSVAFRQVD